MTINNIKRKSRRRLLRVTKKPAVLSIHTYNDVTIAVGVKRGYNILHATIKRFKNDPRYEQYSQRLNNFDGLETFLRILGVGWICPSGLNAFAITKDRYDITIFASEYDLKQKFHDYCTQLHTEPDMVTIEQDHVSIRVRGLEDAPVTAIGDEFLARFEGLREPPIIRDSVTSISHGFLHNFTRLTGPPIIPLVTPIGAGFLSGCTSLRDPPIIFKNLTRVVPTLYHILYQTDMFNTYNLPVELTVMIISSLYGVETKRVHNLINTYNHNECGDIIF